MIPDIYAVIQNGVVINTQVLMSTDVQDPQFTWIVITNLVPQPGIGWSYDGQNFTSPPVKPPTPPTPVQVQVQVSDPTTQQVLTDLLYYQLNNDPSVLQKYIVMTASQQAQVNP
jgi:hypothetical protein